jgi:hypothetical protein
MKTATFSLQPVQLTLDVLQSSALQSIPAKRRQFSLGLEPLPQTTRIEQPELFPKHLDPYHEWDKPHRLAPGKPFAQWGEENCDTDFNLMPCAGRIWRFLLRRRKPGTFQELDFEEFQAYSAAKRYRPYSLKQIRAGFWQLVERGLVAIAKTYPSTHRVYGVIARQVGMIVNTSISVAGKLTSRSGNRLPKQGPQSTDCSFKTADQLTNKRTKPTAPPVLERTKEGVVQNGSDPQLPAPEGGEILDTTALAIPLQEWDREAIVQECPSTIAQTLVEQAHSELGVRITRPIYRLVVRSTIGVVRNAIAAVKERLESKTAAPVKSKEGLFTTALKRRFTPNAKGQRDNTPEAGIKGFGAWFTQVQQAGLVCASYQEHGEILLVLPQGGVMTLAEFGQVHPDWALGQGTEPERLLQPEPVDLAEVIAQTSVEIQRLGWSPQQVATLLVERFKKRSRCQLTDDELFQFLEALQGLGSG